MSIAKAPFHNLIGAFHRKALVWDIKQFFHKDNLTVVGWYFKNKANDGEPEEFDVPQFKGEKASWF